MATCTLVFISFTSFTLSRAFSTGMPCWRSSFCFAGPAGTAKQKLDLQQGIPVEKAREIVKLVKEMKTRVQVAIQGDQVRVSGKKRDDLQAVIQRVRGEDLGIAMQVVNFRD